MNVRVLVVRLVTVGGTRHDRHRFPGLVHSIVRASHGSLPATSPRRIVRSTMMMNPAIDKAITNDPIVDTMFQKSKPWWAG